jgi:Flp pilus assembly protein TadD
MDSKKIACDISFSKLTVDQALDQAFSYYDLGRLLEAEQLCRLVLQKVPCQIDAMQLLGAILNLTGQYDEAVQLLREAIRQAPSYAHLYNNLGMSLHRLDKPDEAVMAFRKAIEIRPDFAKAHNNLAVVLMKQDRIDEAITACREAIRLRGDFKEAYNNLGLALKKKGELENAIASFEKAVNLDPEYAEALSNLGLALIAQPCPEPGRRDSLKEAAANLQKAVSLVPNSAEFHNNLGVLFNRQGRFEEAVAASDKAITMQAEYVEAHNNLGTALIELGRFSEAKAAFERAIAINPECAEAHHNRSLVLLLTAQFEEGWKEYEWRWRHKGFSTPLRPFPQQRWNGSVQEVEKLLVWGEQGIGDEVQFSGLIRHIVSRGITVVIECDRRLVPLLRRSLSGTVVVERTDPPAPLLKDPSITHQIPMASIPRVLGLSPNSMSFQSPFIIPDEEERNRFRSEYKGDGDLVLVGISWRSGNRQEGQKRSIGLEHWGPILSAPRTRFVNLQYGEYSRELQAAHKLFGVRIFKDEKINPLRDLESFAAQVAAMDIVISVDNSTVHFAGALGVKVWTMLPTVPDWRWGLVGDKTRWYPTMRLFRQEERGKWEPVISNVAKELLSLINQDENQ